jgi:predicted AAA+ superfamily ATPase
MTRDTISFLPRLAEHQLAMILQTQPVAVLMGARQSGKSTLIARSETTQAFVHLTLDDLNVRQQALNDPEGLLLRAERLAIDEVQRAPDLLIAIKRAVDIDRSSGRFLLTGSANLLAMKSVQESLAGRASFVTLWPFTRRERLGLGAAGAWSIFFERPFAHWPDALRAQEAPPDDWRTCASESGYPPVATAQLSADAQALWLQGYLDAFLSRDVAELLQLARPLDLLRLMRAACTAIGQVEHQAAWAQTTGLPTSTVSRWVDLLEVTYQLVRIPAFSVNRTSRLTKKPKLYWSDTAMAMHLINAETPSGSHFENMVLSDLNTWCGSQARRPTVHHWRTVTQREVDFVLEMPNGAVLPIEVKTSSVPTTADVAGLNAFLDEYQDLAVGGLLLHTGDEVVRLSKRIIAAPWWRVL